jgi:hypothetical protein
MNALFPASRPRRLRRTAALRQAVRETTLAPSQLVAPLFLKEGIGEPQPVGSMPGVVQHTLDSLRAEAKELRAPRGGPPGGVGGAPPPAGGRLGQGLEQQPEPVAAGEGVPDGA